MAARSVEFIYWPVLLTERTKLSKDKWHAPTFAILETAFKINLQNCAFTRLAFADNDTSVFAASTSDNWSVPGSFGYCRCENECTAVLPRFITTSHPLLRLVADLARLITPIRWSTVDDRWHTTSIAKINVEKLFKKIVLSWLNLSRSRRFVANMFHDLSPPFYRALNGTVQWNLGISWIPSKLCGEFRSRSSQRGDFVLRRSWRI